MVTRLSKNLYNASLYGVRQHFFATETYKNYYVQKPEFVEQKNPDFKALPAKVAGEVMLQAHRGYTSFFALLKKKRAGEYDKPVNIPGYLPKDGKNVVYYPKDALSKKVKKLENGLFLHHACINSKQFRLQVTSRFEKLDMIRIVPRNGYFIIECVYEAVEDSKLKDNGRYASIDLGVNNFVTLVSNVMEPIIFGGLLKSINQYYNKRRAELQSQLPKYVYWSKQLEGLTNKRNFKIKHEMHVIAKQIVNHLVSNNINTLVVGYNKGWKQDINLGKRNNQNFVFLPHSKFVEILRYLCELHGIIFKVTEESYTSQTSFLDNERPIEKFGNEARKEAGKKPAVRRVQRGVFKADSGQVINADVNSGFQIMKKVVPKRKLCFPYGIDAVAIRPRRVRQQSRCASTVKRDETRVGEKSGSGIIINEN